MARIDDANGDRPFVFALRPSGPAVENLERRAAVLAEGARRGAAAVFSAFGDRAKTGLAASQQRG
jgi:hypothetical protein